MSGSSLLPNTSVSPNIWGDLKNLDTRIFSLEKNSSGGNSVINTGGLMSEFYDNTTLNGNIWERGVKSSIDLTNYTPTGAPNSNVIPAYSCRFVGWIYPTFDETYTFYLTTDDGARIYINNKLIVDGWKDQSATLYTGTVTLSANNWTPVSIEHYTAGGSERLYVEWESQHQARGQIPSAQMSWTFGGSSSTSGSISPGSVGVTSIQDDSITTNHIQANSITAEQIQAGTITANEIAANTITANEIAARTITAFNIGADQITANEIRSETITATEILTRTITADRITANTITANEIAAGTITATEISAGSITGSLIAAGTITATNIQAGTITGTLIAATTITATNIAANTITASQIAASTITGDKIAANTITSGNIASATITGSNIAGSTITASNISISQLSALTGDMGTLTAGTITGATVQTASGTGSRVKLSTIGLEGYDGTNTRTFFFDTSTGNLTLKGTVTTGSSVPSSTLTGVISSVNIDPTSLTGVSLPGFNQLLNSNFEDNTSTYYTTTNATAVYSSTVARLGTLSYRLTASSAANMSAQTSASVAIISGQNWTASGYFRPNTTARSVRVRIEWRDNTNAVISTTTGASVTEVSGSWVRAFATGSAPSNATQVRVYFDVLSPASSEIHYVDTVQLEEGNVVSGYTPNVSEIQPNSIGSTQIIDGSIAGSDIAANTITASNIQALTITANEIAANTITGAKIAANTITASLIAANTITAAQIAANTITANEIAAHTITATQIQAGTITTTEIQALTILGGDIAAQTITAANIATDTITATQIAANAITTSELNAGAVTAAKIAAATITSNEIAANTITGGNIAAGTITSANIQAGTISADLIKVGTLSGDLVLNGSFESWATSTSSYSAVIAAESGLQYWWKFSESSGTSATDSKGTNTGTYQGTVTLAQAGITGDSSTGVKFNGTTGFVSTATQIASPGPVGPFTIECWIKATSTGRGIMTFGNNQITTPSNHDRKLYFNGSGQIVFGIFIGSALLLTSPAAYNDGAYHHIVAVVASNNNMKLYVDGVLVASNSNTTAPQAYAGYWRWGNAASTSSWTGMTNAFFDGTIIHSGIYNVELSSTQIANHYSSGIATGSPNGWYAVDGSGTYTVVSNGGVTDGEWALQIGNSGTGNIGIGSKAISVVSGEAYVVRAKLFHTNDADTAKITILEKNATPSNGVYITNTDKASSTDLLSITGSTIYTSDNSYTSYEFVYTVPSGITYITLAFYNVGTNSGFLSVDEAQFVSRIPGTSITPGSITTDLIAAGAITASTISSDAIDGMTITGATIQTALDGPRVVLDSTGITAYDNEGITVSIPDDGSQSTFKGSLYSTGGLTMPVTTNDSSISVTNKASFQLADGSEVAYVGGGSTGAIAYNSSILATTGIVHYWRLGETAGTSLADSIGSGAVSLNISGTYTLNQSSLVPNTTSASILFTAAKAASASAISFAGTYETWVKPTTVDATSRRIFEHGDTTAGLALRHSSSGLVVDIYKSGSTSTWTSSTPLTANSTYYAVAEVSTLSTSTTTNNPATATSQAFSGTSSWRTPNNVFTKDSSTTNASTSGQNFSDYLNATNFGFSIPTNATITGIKVAIAKSAMAGTIYDWYIVLRKAGAVYGDTRAIAGVAWPSSLSYPYSNYGGSSDLWGGTWTPADINSSNFGVSIQAWMVAATSGGVSLGEAAIDNVQVTVYYKYTSPTLYVNGSKKTLTESGTRVLLPAGSGTLAIGEQNAGTNPFVGNIDEFALYSNNLAQTTVSSHYSTGQSSAGYSGAIVARAISSTAGNTDVTVIDGGGASSFPQLLSSAKRKMVFGNVTASAGIGSGTGFSVARTPGGNASGDYTITFTTAFGTTPFVYTTPNSVSNFVVVNTQSITTTSVRVFTVPVNTGSFADEAFSFFAIG